MNPSRIPTILSLSLAAGLLTGCPNDTKPEVPRHEPRQAVARILTETDTFTAPPLYPSSNQEWKDRLLSPFAGEGDFIPFLKGEKRAMSIEQFSQKLEWCIRLLEEHKVRTSSAERRDQIQELIGAITYNFWDQIPDSVRSQ